MKISTRVEIGSHDMNVVVVVSQFWRNISIMAPQQWKVLLVIVLKFLLASLSVGLQCNFMLLTQAFVQYQTLRMEANF